MSGQHSSTNAINILVQYFDGTTKQVSGFDKIPNREQVSAITCNYCELKTLPPGLVFPELVSFNCSANQLVEVPDDMQMPKLRKFWCYGNKLHKLPDDLSARFPCLELLWCGGNFLTELPAMEFTNLREFNCENNQLRQLNETMAIPNLNHFVCCKNKLTRFPDAMLSWQKLKYLDISSNYGAEPLILSDTQKIFLFDKKITVMR